LNAGATGALDWHSVHRTNSTVNLIAQPDGHAGHLHGRAGCALRTAAGATLLLLVVAPVGCVTVDPRPDFAQASAEIRAHPGSRELLDEDVGSQRSFDEARAELESAEASLRADKKQQLALRSIEADSLPEDIAPLAITSPIDGVLNDIHTAVGDGSSSPTRRKLG